MSYFTKDLFKFFNDLEKNNSREWFNENKKRYEDSVKKPFHDFIQDAINIVATDDPMVTIEPKDAIFRIHRDVRFSPNKAPYKTQASAVVSRGGRKDFSTPGMYIEFNGKEGKVYSGFYEIEKDKLHAMQQAFLDQQAMQCGYCVPGHIMTAVAFARENPKASREEIVSAMSEHICRCCNYSRILAAVEQVVG